MARVLVVMYVLAGCGGAKPGHSRVSDPNACNTPCDLATARNTIRMCGDPGRLPCFYAVSAIWEQSDLPTEVTAAVSFAQNACVKDNALCSFASEASWIGRGVPVDAVASLGWSLHEAVAWPGRGFFPTKPARNIIPPHHAVDRATRLARLRALVTIKAHHLITDELAGERWMFGPLDQEFLAIRASSMVARWDLDVEPLLVSPKITDKVLALAVAEGLVELAPGDSEIERRRDHVRAELAAISLAKMEQAKAAKLPFLAWFYGARAAQFGSTAPVPVPDEKTKLVVFPTATKLTAPADCRWLGSGVSDSQGGPPLDVNGELTCSATETVTVVTNEPYTYTAVIDVEETELVAGSKTVMINHPTKGPTMTTIETPGESVRVKRKHEVEAQGTRVARHRILSVSVTGSLKSSKGNAPVNYQKTVDEAEYSTPHGSKAFTSLTLEKLKDGAREAVAIGLRTITYGSLEKAIAQEHAASSAAPDRQTADEHDLRAYVLGARGTMFNLEGLGDGVSAVLDGNPLILPDLPEFPRDTAPPPTPMPLNLSMFPEPSYE